MSSRDGLMKTLFKFFILFYLLILAATAQAETSMNTVQYRREKVDGFSIFYREAGDKSRPTILLLHGFPSSSHMFRDLIPKLASQFHVVAPDYPGFGYSDMPPVESFDYSFDHLATMMEKFLKQTGNTKFFVYLQDYGGPVGFRIATRHPEWVEGLIIQNANAYDEGVSAAIKDLLGPIWKKRDSQTEARLLPMFELDNTKFQYQSGARNKDAMNPDSWTHDQFLLDRPGSKLIQLELQATYYKNLELYEGWHRYFREKQPPTLVVWGRRDPIFTEAGALAYKKDLKNIEIHLLETGHFALEEDCLVIAEKIIAFIARVKGGEAK